MLATSKKCFNTSVSAFRFRQETDTDDRLGLPGDADGECDSKADTPDVPLSTADTDNTPQCLNKALEGLPPRYERVSRRAG